VGRVIKQLPYKSKKTPEELVKHILKPNGVKFEIVKEEDAIPYLKDLNYYYKFTCYRKNFWKDKKKKYKDLDFGYLVHLSDLDKELRHILLTMILEIEHNIKTQILRHISYNPKVDGYEIVHDYISSYNAKYSEKSPFLKKISIENFIKRGRSASSAGHGIYNKVKENNNYIAIWQLIEFMEFRELQYFFEYYFTRFQEKYIDVPPYVSLMVSSRYIRNAAAHNNPLLINLSAYPSDAIKKNGINKRYLNSLLQDHFRRGKIAKPIQFTHRFKDIASTFKLYKILREDANASNDPMIGALDALFKKIKTDSLFPTTNNDVAFFFTNLQKIYDDIYKKN